MASVAILQQEAKAFKSNDSPNNGPTADAEQMGYSIEAWVALSGSVVKAIDNRRRDALLRTSKLIR